MEKLETKKYKPITYRYYDYLKENHYGKENGISRKDLAQIFDVDLATQKKILTEINESEIFDKLVSTSGSIYICRTREECETAYYNEIKSGLARLLKGKKMAQKVMRNNQTKIKLGDYYREIVETFEV